MAVVALANPAALADQVRNHEWWLPALQVTRAWESSHGSGVTVAVLDTGVDARQPDLAGSVITGPDFTGSGRAPGQPYWGTHGTAVASLIAGHGHGPGDSDGVAGVAPAAKILSVRVTLEANDPLLADPPRAAALPAAIARGIRYAVKNGAGVIDLPLDPVTAPGAPGSGRSPAERRAVAYALAHHVVLVAPAGDNGAGTNTVNYPAAYPGVISVGAFDAKFVKAPFSIRRPYVTLTAAGQGVTAATPAGYEELNSTSAASAVVAGVVALIRAQFPGLTPAQVASALTRSTAFHRPGGRRNGSGSGTVDAAGALVAAAGVAEAVPTAAAATPAPPSPPAIRTAAATSLSHRLGVDGAIAAAVFLVLVGLFFALRVLQRRRARSARLAEVRAAIQVPVKNVPPAAVPQPAVPQPAAASRHTGFLPAPLPDVPGAPAHSGPGKAGLAAGGGPVTEPGSPEGLGNPGLTAARPAGGALPSRLARARALGGGAAAHAAPAGTAASLGFSSPGAWDEAPAAFPGSAFPAADYPAAGGRAPETASGPGAAPAGPLAQRTGAVHRPKVSGSPPWDPAPPPNSALPWNQAPAPHSAGPGSLPQRRPRPAGVAPSWDAIAEEVWPGGPRSAERYPAAAPPPEPASQAAAAGERSQRDRPIYLWHPESAGSAPPPGPAISPKGKPPWETESPPDAPPWERAILASAPRFDDAISPRAATWDVVRGGEFRRGNDAPPADRGVASSESPRHSGSPSASPVGHSGMTPAGPFAGSGTTAAGTPLWESGAGSRPPAWEGGEPAPEEAIPDRASREEDAPADGEPAWDNTDTLPTISADGGTPAEASLGDAPGARSDAAPGAWSAAAPGAWSADAPGAWSAAAEGALPGDVPWAPRGDEPGDAGFAAGWDTRPPGAAWADEVTDSFSAVAARQDSGGFRLSLPGEHTETSPAAPRTETFMADPRAQTSPAAPPAETSPAAPGTETFPAWPGTEDSEPTEEE